MDRLNAYAGISYPEERVKGILESLGFGINSIENEWQVTPPSWRNDVAYEVDLFEEVMRIYGFDEIPLTIALMIRIQIKTGTLRKIST